MGVPMGLASGDDILTAETREMLGPIEVVTTKLAMSRSAGAGFSPARVQAELRTAAGRAVRRVRAGELKPLRMAKPYQVRFCMRQSYDAWFVNQVRQLAGLRPDGGERCFAYTSQSAEEVGDLLNRIEWIVLKP
jgi:D-aminopeptidase